MKPEDADFEAWLYDVGMPIGNLPSQLFGNVVLNELDQFVKHRLKARKYERYMDDGLFLSDSKETLNAWKQAVGDYLRQELHLDLNDKTAIRPVTMGIEFVGRRVWATRSRLRKSTVRRLKNEVHGICRQRAAGTLSKAGFERRCASIRGMLDSCECASLRWRLNEIYLNILGGEQQNDPALPFG